MFGVGGGEGGREGQRELEMERSGSKGGGNGCSDPAEVTVCTLDCWGDVIACQTVACEICLNLGML